ncbi:MAG: hypothetical protein HOV80_15745 [Polyangiaceae bacterium]|nr:hypothetical protein [Polyangiaceae bacterium]
MTLLLGIGLAGCSAASSTGGTEPTSGPPVGTPLGAEEKAACDGKGYASLKCLVAARGRRVAGDAKAATELLELGCDNGDLEACLDIGKTAKVADTCKASADTKEHAVACERFQNDSVIDDEGRHVYKLKVKEALDLRSKYGPALLAEVDAVKRACAPLPFDKSKSASLDGTSIAKEPGLVDATILCPDRPLSTEDMAKLKDGRGSSSPPVPRTLKDGFYRSGTTLDASAPAGDGLLGVSCPSRLAADRWAVDIWLKMTDGEGETLVVIAVPGQGTCVAPAEEKKTFQEDRVFLDKLLKVRRAAVDKTLDQAAAACDAGIGSAGKMKISIDAAALNASAAQVRCDFGRAFTMAGEVGELQEAGTFITGHMDFDGLVMRTQLFTDGKRRALMTFRKRDATLMIEAKEPPPLPTK